MEYYLIIIPILFTVICAFITYNNKDGKKSFAIYSIEDIIGAVLAFISPTLLTLLLIFVMSSCMKYFGNEDVEYLSYYYTKLRHTDKWNEYINRTCTRRVKVGTDSNGNDEYEEEEYDCSYVEDHPERWIAYDNDSNEIYLNEDEWNGIKNNWKVPSIFVDMHRDYYSIDGDAQDYIWNNNKLTIETYTEEHPYKNYVKNTQSQFSLRDISDEEAKTLGLYQYPQIDNNEQSPIVGYKQFIKNSDVKELQWFNSIYGKKKQIRTFVLIFPNSSPSVVEDQRCYWQGGNKNEFVCCVGVDKNTNKLQWVKCFSWLDNATMELKCETDLMKNTVFSVQKYSQWLQKNIKLWKRKQFSDFEYISNDVELTSEQLLTIFAIVLLFNIIMFVAIISIRNKEARRNENWYID
jgi:hypothetical protein